MSDEEKIKLLEDMFSLPELRKYERKKCTSGYTQVQPNGKQQVVLLFGFDEKRNSIKAKIPLCDAEEAVEVYQAILFLVAQRNINSRPKLGTFKSNITNKESPFSTQPIETLSPLVEKQNNPTIEDDSPFK